ncbi:MAG: hypothetical protein HUU54_14070 [Ignavibacteriaceae bacterium]|nr:hypothetical protein [Ignavibacteriaceae bacterium]
MKKFPAFSLKEINKLSSKVYYHRLAAWQKKGYIRRIANGVFVFADEKLDELHLFYLANRIYEPSYISLESAFAYYGFIPEAVYRITSVSTKKTSEFKCDDIVFNYKTIHRRLNFGYHLINWKNVTVKIAEPEKAVIDYFYLNPEINTTVHIEEMRFNQIAMNELIDWNKVVGCPGLYNNVNLRKRIQLLIDWLKNA